MNLLFAAIAFGFIQASAHMLLIGADKNLIPLVYPRLWRMSTRKTEQIFGEPLKRIDRSLKDGYSDKRKGFPEKTKNIWIMSLRMPMCGQNRRTAPGGRSEDKNEKGN